ncbi:SpaA isopeptide-forming pilin-related protein [Algibacter sp.]|nr:SpaA isopeptide-forming pilin-related protein [Algibacter sp.]
MAFIIAMLFSIVSCESDDSNIPFSDLEVYVSGTLSGNPRSGLRVTVYDTEDDAMNEVNAVTSTQTTDSNGYAFFENLEPGFRYWVRVDTTLINNINRTEQLDEGFNEMSMTIL